MLQVVRYCLVYIYVLYFQIIQLPVVLWFFQHSSSLLSISHKNPSFRIIYASWKLRNPCPFYETLSLQSYFQWMLLYIHFLHGSILRLLFQIHNNTSGELYNFSTRSLKVSKKFLSYSDKFVFWSLPNNCLFLICVSELSIKQIFFPEVSIGVVTSDSNTIVLKPFQVKKSLRKLLSDLFTWANN